MTKLQSIHLYLWRHGEAEDGADDLARALTPRGRRDAARVARVLAKQLDPNTQLIASPAVRTRETAEPLAAKVGVQVEVDRRLAPGARVESVLAVLEDAIGAAEGETASIVLVGHQPWLGQVARRLLSDDAGDLSVKKAAAWWLVRRVRDGTAEWALRTVIDPDLA